METFGTSGSRKYQIYIGNLKAIDFSLNELYGPGERRVTEAVAMHVISSSRCNPSIDRVRTEDLRQRLTRSWSNEMKARAALENSDYHGAELSVPECWRQLSYAVETLADVCLVLLRRTQTFPRNHATTLKLLSALAKEKPCSILPAPWSYWIAKSGETCCDSLEVAKRLNNRCQLRIPMPHNYIDYWPRILHHAVRRPKDGRACTPFLTPFNYIYSLRLRADYPDSDIDFFIAGASERNWSDFHEFSRQPILRFFGGSMTIFESILLKGIGAKAFQDLLDEYKSGNVSSAERKRFETSIEARVNLLIATMESCIGQAGTVAFSRNVAPRVVALTN